MPPLKSSRSIADPFSVETVDHFDVVRGLSVRGATEKSVLQCPDTGHLFIAKLGRRNNDLEVMTEQAIFLIGRSLGVIVAEGAFRPS